MAVVGIDLGTTNTVISAVRDGRATALKDKSGRALLPSVVSFGIKGAAKVGYPARDRRTLDPENTVFSIKRLIGRTFDSEHVQKSIPRYPFKLKEGPGRSTIVSCHGRDHTLPDVSALVLQEAASIAEKRLGERVTDAVITVPANFNDLQRAATKIAGRSAGLEVLRIINEPTAAALAYGFGKRGRERIVVYDFGGGTFDVTLLDLNENVFEVLATAGDTFLGGDDVDRAIMDRMAESLLKTQKIDASSDILVREQLRVAAEKLKIELSSRSMAKAKIEDLEFEFVLRRSEFEALTEPLLARTLSVCQEAMDVAGMFIKDIDQVLLVGGSTRIPLVRRRVSSFFSKMPQSRINPDEVVAIGAAIQAASLESKQGLPHVPAAPRPRAAHARPSTAAQGAVAGTKSGLAGLRKTLSGTGVKSDLPEAKRPSSVLSGLKSTPPPAPRATAPAAPKGINPAQTLGGMGPSRASLPALKSSRPPHSRDPVVRPAQPAREPLGTLSGVGERKDNHTGTLSGTIEPQGNTNLGLGQAPGSPPAPLGAPPPRAVVPAPGGVPRKRPPPPAPQQPASLNEQMNQLAAAEKDAEKPADGDGSVTFDLEDLEEAPTSSAISETDFDEETTEIFDRNAKARKAETAASPKSLTATSPGGTKLDDVLDAELPAVVSKEAEFEELGDSALFMLPDEEDKNEDLPEALRPASKAVAPRFSEDSELMALADLAHDEDDELDLPSPTSRRTSLEPRASEEEESDFDRESDLPLPVIHAPSTDGPSYQTSHGVELTEQLSGSVDLPATRARKPPPPELTQTAIGVAPAHNAPSEIEVAPPAIKTGPEFSARPPAENLDFGLGGTQVAHAQPSAPQPQRAEADEFVLDAKRPVGLSTEPGGTFDPSFPARAIMDSVAELDEAAAAPLDSSYNFAQQENHAAQFPTEPEQAPNQGMHADVDTMMGRPLLLDVTPLSLGVEVVGGYVDKLIERNSPVPCECTRTFATASDNQAVVRVRVSQGEEGRFEQNTVLGEVQLSGLSPGPRGSVKIDVSFSLDESGMLQVSARDPKTGLAADAQLRLAGVNAES